MSWEKVKPSWVSVGEIAAAILAKLLAHSKG